MAVYLYLVVGPTAKPNVQNPKVNRGKENSNKLFFLYIERAFVNTRLTAHLLSKIKEVEEQLDQNSATI